MCVLVYARTHTQTTWVLDVRPGVGRTPGEPEESRSTKAHYACFDGVNEETNVRANAAVVPGYADVRASAVMSVAGVGKASPIGGCLKLFYRKRDRKVYYKTTTNGGKR